MLQLLFHAREVRGVCNTIKEGEAASLGLEKASNGCAPTCLLGLGYAHEYIMAIARVPLLFLRGMRPFTLPVYFV